MFLKGKGKGNNEKGSKGSNAKGKGIGAIEGMGWDQVSWDQFTTLGAMGWGGFSGLYAVTDVFDEKL